MLYRLIQFLAWPVVRGWFRLAVRGTEHVPARGGAIIAVNHASYADPPLLGCALTTRPVHFMAKEELFRIPLMGRFIRANNALPIRRGVVNRRAMEEFRRLVHDRGGALLVFPEGTRTPDGRLGEARRGVGALCRAAGVPIIPALITGSYAYWPRWRRLPRLRGRIEVRFGPPVQWADDELNAAGDPSGALATLIMKRISELHDTTGPALGFWEGYRNILRRPSAVRPVPPDHPFTARPGPSNSEAEGRP